MKEQKPLDLALQINDLTATIQLLRSKTVVAVKKKAVLKLQLSQIADATGKVSTGSTGLIRTRQQRVALGICVECGIELIDGSRSKLYGSTCLNYLNKRRKENVNNQIKDQENTNQTAPNQGTQNL